MAATGHQSPYKDRGVERLALFPVISSSLALRTFLRLITVQLVPLTARKSVCDAVFLLADFLTLVFLNVKKRIFVSLFVSPVYFSFSE